MDKWITEIEHELRACGKILLEADRSQTNVDAKAGQGNFVTAYDKMLQNRLQENLCKILPEAVFVGEEEDIHASIANGFAFIVDPIDGTFNFMRDYHTSCISVGVTYDGKPYAGIIYNPYLDEMYTAQTGCGAYLNGKRIHVSDKPLKNSLVIMGTSSYYEELNDETFRRAYMYFKYAHDIRRSGSAALDLCSIAAGRMELFYELRVYPWDYAAGLVITQEAGGKVLSTDYEELTLEGPTSIIAGSPKLLEEVKELDQKHKAWLEQPIQYDF